MSNFSLRDRVRSSGTLAEPEGIPDPRYALPGTVNWMKALALLVQHHGVTFGNATTLYATVQKRASTIQEENTIFEQLLFALNQVSALGALRATAKKSDVARVGIVAWYYGIYTAASAMVAAQDGSFQDDHTSTANAWDRQFAAFGPVRVMPPFSLRVSSLVESIYESEVAAMRTGPKFALTHAPSTNLEAHGACCAYLSGNAAWWKWKAEESLKATREFKVLNVTDFRGRAARDLRDSRLQGKAVSFVHQAFRYRGKANYRDAVFLGYGTLTEVMLTDYIDNLASVLRGFVSMAGAFCAKRIGQPLWNDFVNDLEINRSFSSSPKSIWT